MNKINLTWMDVLNTRDMKIFEIYNTDENIGPAPKGACSKPMSSLPASWVSSCKSQGKMKRTGNRKEKVGGKINILYIIRACNENERTKLKKKKQVIFYYYTLLCINSVKLCKYFT